MTHLMKLKATLNIFQVTLRRKNYFYAIKPMSVLCLNFKEPIYKSASVSPSLFTIPVRFAKKAQGKMPKGGKPKVVQISDSELSEVIDVEEYRDQLQTIVENLKKDFVDNLSLRSLNIENIIIEMEDQEYPLHELAQISRKNPTLIAINMVDFPEAIKPAVQAIINSGSGLNPQQDGTMIYLAVPKVTREHRENLAKNAKSLFVRAKEEVRSVQNFFVKDAKRKTDLSEDLIFNASNQIMNIAEQTATNLEKILKIKQKELLGES